MSIGTEAELKAMKRAGAVVAEALQAMKRAVEPGVTPAELDALCGEVYARHNAESAPRLVYGAPVNAFISVNEDVVHGLPTLRPLQPNDLVKLDVTPSVNGFIADAAITVVVPPASPQVVSLVACAEAAFWAAMKVAKAGKRVHVIGRAVEQEVVRRGFFVIRELSGHSLGRTIHEEPQVLNFYLPQDRAFLTDGLVLAVEPMVSVSRSSVTTRADGWTIGTRNGSLTAHFEHTVMITRGQPLILTA